MFRDDGSQVSTNDMRMIDRHEVCQGVTLTDSIVAGGAIETDVRGSTVEVRDDGKVAVASIDDLPDSARV
jgi:hypothetical protein